MIDVRRPRPGAGGRGRAAVVGRGGGRGHAHPRGADALREAAGRGARRGRGRPRAARLRRHVPGRAVRHAARRLQPVRAHAHPVTVGRRPAGRLAGPGVPSAFARRVQRDGRAAADARRPSRLPEAPVAVPAQPVRGLPVLEHLRAVPRSVPNPFYVSAVAARVASIPPERYRETPTIYDSVSVS